MTMKRVARAVVCVALAASVHLAAQEAPDRGKPPATGQAPTLKLPAIEKRQLSNGIPVWFVELHEVPVVQVNLVVMSGSGDDPVGAYGISSFTTAMLEEGAGSRSALEIADAVDFLGASLSATSGSDSSAVRLHVPVSRLADALPIMADVALRPTFPKDELERLRQQRLTGLLQARDDPATIASLAFSRVLYGPAHRYGTAMMGTADTIGKFTVEDLRAYYTSRFRPGNAVLLVVGDVKPDTVQPLLEKAFGTWMGGAPAARVPLPAVPARTRREVYLVDKPGAPQSEIRIGSVGVPRSTPDYFPIQVMNTILGGSFSSRLNENLREKHGYTYGAGSSFDMRSSAGPFAAVAAVQTDKTSEALKEFFSELNGIRQPAPADEVSRSRNYIALRFPGTFETTADVSSRLEQLIVYRLPENYFRQYVENVEAVSPGDVGRAATQYVQPDKVVVVVVGDLKVVEPGIRALNLGPTTVLTLDQVFGSTK